MVKFLDGRNYLITASKSRLLLLKDSAKGVQVVASFTLLLTINSRYISTSNISILTM